MAVCKKLTIAGKVAVIYSPSGWWGWSTDHMRYPYDPKAMMFDPDLARAISLGRPDSIKKVVDLKFGEASAFCDDLRVAWIPTGTRFKVVADEGRESILTIDDLPYAA